MNFKPNSNTDVLLVTMMVAKLLESEHQIDKAPSFADYRVMASEVRPNGSTDIRVAIPLSRGITIDVNEHWWGDDVRDLSHLVEAATEIAMNISTVHEMKEDIIAVTKEVRTAASREIAKAKRRGGDFRLVSAIPRVEYPNFGEGVVVDLILERVSDDLGAERVSFEVDCAAEVAETFEYYRKVQ